MFPKCRIAVYAVLAAALLGLSTAADAQSWPSKPVRWVLGFPPGGGTDFVARLVAAELSRSLGQTVVVENRPGAGGIIGAEAAARAAPDGYTLWTGDNGTLVLNPLLYRKLPYEAKDFAPVGFLARFPLILAVNPGVHPVATVQELVALARQQPGRINFASPGPGSPHHLAMELLRVRTGMDIVHVPYKGGPPAMQDLLGGQVGAMFSDTPTGMPHVRAGKIRALAVADPQRNPALPGVPTMVEAGVADFVVLAWQALMVPAATPAEIVARLARELGTLMRAPEVTRRLREAALEPMSGGPEEVAALIRSETATWGEVIRLRGIRLD